MGIFHDHADPQLENIEPLSNITSYIHFPDEEEVLFMIGSIFRLVHVNREQDGIWMIYMSLCSDNDHQLKTLLEHLKRKYDHKENTLISFGDVLCKMSRLDEAEKCYYRCLHEAYSDHKSIVRCYYSMSSVAMKRDNLDLNLIWFNKSLEIKLRTLILNDPEIANEYNSIGKTSRKKRESN